MPERTKAPPPKHDEPATPREKGSQQGGQNFPREPGQQGQTIPREGNGQFGESGQQGQPQTERERVSP